ncbi:MAG: hypothetical protein K2Y51_01800 [Gammaproteobacteria bacterium]|nr:hypothetical protein [Gammaproteobacteria bacterium]
MAVKRGTSRNDSLIGGASADVLFGLAGDDRLVGRAGDDLLDGGRGRDQLRGDAGDDTYVIDGPGEIDKTLTDPGLDLVKAAVSYALGVHQENLTLLGVANLLGTGNDGANTLLGNRGDNRLHGRGGADTLRGGAGDDVLIFDGADLVQSGGSGTDTLLFTGAGLAITSTTLQRAAAIEALDIHGSGANALTLTAARVASLSDSDTLRVRAGSDDLVTAHGAWQAAGARTLDGVSYARFTQGDATLLVEAAAPRLVGGAMPLANLNGTNGYRLDGLFARDNLGGAVANVGDVNGDGLDDLFIGAPSFPTTSQPRGAFVLFGRAEASESSVELAALDGSDGFRLVGDVPGAYDIFAMSGVGDINGDGFADMLIGDRLANGRAGVSYLVFGRADGFPAALDLNSLDGNTGFKLTGVQPGDSSGWSVSSAGDVNGDGFDDLMIGAPFTVLGGNSAGSIYVVFGHAQGFGASLDLGALDGSDGFRIDSPEPFRDVGIVVAAAGDINGDGFDDVLASTPFNGPIGPNNGAGVTYVVYGKADGQGPVFDLGTLDGANGFEIVGATPEDRSGVALAGAGDVNGDGVDDFLIGADLAASNGAGTSYVVFGNTQGFAPQLDLATLDGSNGFRIDGAAAQHFSGGALAAAGDVNGDGYDDILIGVYRETPNGARSGSSYVVFGRGDGFAARLALSDIDGTNGIRLDGTAAETFSGVAVSGAGDVNGDGFDDLLVGAPSGNPNLSGSGAAYVVHGRDFNGVVTRQGGPASDTLSGTSADENFVGGLGDDHLDGGGGADVLRGGGGNDTLVWRDGLRRADGGGGEDRLRLVGAGVTLDLTAVADSRISGIERIDLTGSGDNTLRLAVRDVLALPDASDMFLETATRQLVVEGDAGDRIEASGQGWVAGQDVTLAGVLYATYTHADAAVTLLIDSSLARDLS